MHRLPHPAKMDVVQFDAQRVFTHTMAPLTLPRLSEALTENADWRGSI